MTGRDYKQLIRLHRETKQFLEPSSNENYKQLSKLIDSAHNTAALKKYQPVNYDLFKDFIHMRKEAAVDSLQKVKKYEDFNKQKKDVLFTKNHTMIWFKEWSKLYNQLKNTEVELEESLKFKQNSIDYLDMFDGINFDEENEKGSYFKDIEEIDQLDAYTQKLNDERIKFKVRTIHPIKDLGEDLQYCIHHNAKKLSQNPEQYEQIMNTIDRVKNQQASIIEKLELEARSAESDMIEAAKQVNEDENTVEEGVPSAAFELESPDEELRLSVLQEFIIIDFKYKEKLKHLKENHISLEANGPYGGWTKEESETFQHIYEQYHSHNLNLVNCNFTLRELMFDRIRRSLQKNLDRAQLVKYEEWNNSNKYFQQQKKLVINEWKESRRSLLTKAEAIFAEAYELIEKKHQKNEEREKQQRICQQLYEKVTKWRNQKLEALEIQQKIDDMIKRQNNDRIRFENEQKERKRMKEKKAIQDYKDRVEAVKRQQENEEQKRLNKLMDNFNEQVKRDQQRIEYRKKQYHDRNSQIKAQKERLKAVNDEKEKRLEKFYDSVKPNVEADPARMISYTEAELARRGVRKSYETNTEDSKFLDPKPLYNNFSFNDKQINSDARLRIETRLRQAGLINSEYARAIINNVKPPSQPRKDINSNSNWSGFAFTQ